MIFWLSRVFKMHVHMLWHFLGRLRGRHSTNGASSHQGFWRWCSWYPWCVLEHNCNTYQQLQQLVLESMISWINNNFEHILSIYIKNCRAQAQEKEVKSELAQFTSYFFLLTWLCGPLNVLFKKNLITLHRDLKMHWNTNTSHCWQWVCRICKFTIPR